MELNNFSKMKKNKKIKNKIIVYFFNLKKDVCINGIC